MITMVKNVIKGPFPMFLRVIATYVGKMKILDYFMIANGKECD